MFHLFSAMGINFGDIYPLPKSRKYLPILETELSIKDFIMFFKIFRRIVVRNSL